MKIAVTDAAAVAERLEALGAEPVRAREFEDNRLYDRPDLGLTRSGRLLRIREAGGRTVITAKAPPERDAPGYKVRREAETEVPSAEEFAEVLETAGFRPLWRYQKYRTTWRLPGAVVTLDELPHGAFLEIEGEPEAIDRWAAGLGASPADYRTDSYRDVHEEWCAAQGVPVGDMVFEEAP